MPLHRRTIDARLPAQRNASALYRAGWEILLDARESAFTQKLDSLGFFASIDSFDAIDSIDSFDATAGISTLRWRVRKQTRFFTVPIAATHDMIEGTKQWLETWMTAPSHPLFLKLVSPHANAPANCSPAHR